MAKRYCPMCDQWTTKRECPACGMDTERAAPTDPSRHTWDGPLPTAPRRADGSLVDDPAPWPEEETR